MKLTIGQIAKAHSTLMALNSTRMLDGVTMFNLYSNIEAINVELKKFAAVRAKLEKEYKIGMKLEEGEIDRTEDYRLKIEELTNILIEIKIIKVSCQYLSGIAPAELPLIAWMLKEKINVPE